MHPRYRAAERAVGRAAARRGLQVVYGGAALGLMREVADAALCEGGAVTGVLPSRPAWPWHHHRLRL
ncbi:TIGR00730 family Rossman fold protein, partial [Streptomyces sp. TR02-1]